MLFDLRSPGRRRVVKTVYLFLAVLIGVGLVGFGVGTGGSFGGIFNAAGQGGGGSGTADAAYHRELATAEKKAKRSPQDAAAWVAVGNAAFAVATLPSNHPSTGYTVAGHAALVKLKSAWTTYMALAPTKPNLTFAEEVASAFASPPTGIGDYPTAQAAQEVVVEAQPTYQQYYALAVDAYQAKDVKTGELAGARAIALAPKSAVKQVTQYLDAYKALAGATGASGATGATGATG